MADQTESPRSHGRRRWFGRVAKGIGILALVIAALAVGTAYRLTRGPLALPDWAVDRVEARINAGVAPASATISDVLLDYDLASQGLQLRVRGAALSDAQTEMLALPEARITLDAGNLLRGRLRPREVDFDGLALNVTRDADGRIGLLLGQRGNGRLPRDPAELLAALDNILAAPMVAGIGSVRMNGLTLRLSDAITGIKQDVRNGQITVARQDDGVRLTLSMRLPVGAGQASSLAVTLTRGSAGTGAQATVALVDVPLAYLAESAPQVPALALATGAVSVTASMALAEDGSPGTLAGQVTTRNLRAVDSPLLSFDRTTLRFAWLPGTGRVALQEVSASSDAMALQASGQILIPEGITGPLQMQMLFDDTIFDPDGMFERRIAFDSGVIEARLTQSPLALDLGQAMVTGPSGTARLSGQLAFAPEGLDGGLTLDVPDMPVEDVKALWPDGLQLQARNWVFNNMIGGTAHNLSAALRLAPGRAPEVLANFDFDGGQVRYMRFMPPAENARGAAQFDGRRLALRVDGATVPAIGPGQTATPDTPRLRIGGTQFTIPDTTERPIRGALSLQAEGDLGDVLTLLDNRPLRILQRLNKDRDFLTGTGTAQVEVSLPLRKGNAPADIDWRVMATLRDVASDKIVSGRTILAERLNLTVSPEAVEVSGAMTFDGIPFDGGWRQALPPRGTEAIDPDAPPPPPVPLPEAGRVVGTAQVSPDDLARLGINLAALDLSGRTPVDVSVSLPQGQAPEVQISSRLRGMSIALPAISWSKPANRDADLALTARLGATPEVTSISVDAPGLAASGNIRFRDGGGLDRATFDQVDTGWFRGPLVLRGRGPGSAPAISIGGGTADLRRALLGRGAGGSGGSGSPLTIALHRLTVTDGIALTDLRANLASGAGQFTGRLNGGSAVEGVLVPTGGGTRVQIRGADAGGVLRSSGLFKDARGGVIQLTLQPTGQTGTYDGALRISDLRVRNAPALASLLQALSVVGILEQLDGDGLSFQSVESDFTLRPGDIRIGRASAVGPSMSITADGIYDLGSRTMDMQGVISPIYLVNGLFGGLFSRRDEGLFGFTYRLQGAASDPQVSVNPLSILTPGIFRDIFRSPPPDG
ncbi:AsmA-like C-terminal region-containing protein [Jannaschia sp. 2305UL9-9]|uniref:AsmA-like C-terminal region-containing protein n=1 Tax=Jannaschia sp. 2305UL9-9 TaxID=3121638 RepID=UPI003529434C